jgi:hypothetical protein
MWSLPFMFPTEICTHFSSPYMLSTCSTDLTLLCLIVLIIFYKAFKLWSCSCCFLHSQTFPQPLRRLGVNRMWHRRGLMTPPIHLASRFHRPYWECGTVLSCATADSSQGAADVKPRVKGPVLLEIWKRRELSLHQEPVHRLTRARHVCQLLLTAPVGA